MNNKTKSALKILTGFSLSFIMLVYIYKRIDINKIDLNSTHFDWKLLTVAFFFLAIIYITHSFRWKYILLNKITLNDSIISVVIAFGLNAMLPFRSGDILKLVYLNREAGVPFSHGITRLFFEKVMDVITLLFITLVTVLTILKLDYYFVLLPTIITIFFISILVFVMYRPEWIKRLIGIPGRLFQGLQGVCDYLLKSLTEFSRFLTWSRICISLIYTIFIWLLLEYLFFNFTLRTIGIELDYFSIIVIITFAAFGIAVPSAPSGIGVFHASVMTAFEILGYSPEQGLIGATLLHLMITIPISFLTVLVFLKKTFKNKKDYLGNYKI